jgi:hypothetical protein
MRMSALARRSFELDGRSYAYHVAEGYRTWDNERAVEIPVCWSAVRDHGNPSGVVEVGNVLGHYDRPLPAANAIAIVEARGR